MSFYQPKIRARTPTLKPHFSNSILLDLLSGHDANGKRSKHIFSQMVLNNVDLPLVQVKKQSPTNKNPNHPHQTPPWWMIQNSAFDPSAVPKKKPRTIRRSIRTNIPTSTQPGDFKGFLAGPPPRNSRPSWSGLINHWFPLIRPAINPLFLGGGVR